MFIATAVASLDVSVKGYIKIMYFNRRQMTYFLVHNPCGIVYKL